MSELLLPYNREIFPYAGILEDLTTKIKTQKMAPVEAYAAFLDERDALGLSIYFDYPSTSITTGGHARVPGKQMGEVIAANTRTARQMVALLHKQGTLLGKEVVLPVDLGNTGWKQSEFLTYWCLTLAGLDVRQMRNVPQGLTVFEQHLTTSLRNGGVDLSLMNDSKVDRELRRPEYGRFVKAMAGVAKEATVSRTPAHRLISLVDPQISVGCWAESEFAQQLDIPRQKIVPVKPASINEAVPVPTLREDITVITALGGTVCVAAEGSMLTLVGA